MRCFVIVFIVEFILCYNGGYGMQLPWSLFQSRNLLENKSPLPEKGKSLVSVKTVNGTATALLYGGKLKVVQLPLGLNDPKITNVTLKLRSSNRGWSFYEPSNKLPGYFPYKSWDGDLYTGRFALTEHCQILGAKRNVSVNISSSKDNAVDVEALSGDRICRSELGAPLICGGKLAGLVHNLLKNITEDQSTVKGEDNSSLKEEATEETIPGTDKPVEDESPPPKERKKRDEEEKKEEKEGEEKEGEEKEGEEKIEEEEEEGECSNSCEVTPMGLIIEKPPKPPKPPTKPVPQTQEDVAPPSVPVASPRKSGAMVIIAKNDLLLILLFSSIFLLF